MTKNTIKIKRVALLGNISCVDVQVEQNLYELYNLISDLIYSEPYEKKRYFTIFCGMNNYTYMYKAHPSDTSNEIAFLLLKDMLTHTVIDKTRVPVILDFTQDDLKRYMLVKYVSLEARWY